MNQLCHDEVASVLNSAFLFYQNRGDLWRHLLLVMPDHLHTIISFNREIGMEKSMREFKKFTARTTGITWQRDFFLIIVFVGMNPMSRKRIIFG
ncbi:transposase [Pontiellaceae bacterium B1224]|nr:transposase [Pontiellaceae bacterium B1224]